MPFSTNSSLAVYSSCYQATNRRFYASKDR
ncbi:hypothetical protein MED222_05600 [Vibrio sp. MED222]|nr:hypothetical protein MED222_05600 [Vibrio sp. MED222]